ncbi:hypothetical protein K466DRAFT_12327 [Polyporus arcularius HHB13444]|uniref:Uncharacterized protein n=1 Tax=Polyporus arcularius HHB13444 TaxID=1314778 RepID=A0A5C3NPS9_9APHY|nr:hypothetical protein K466DRAFT_12327 [Polyporus arcularius HHB13444]
MEGPETRVGVALLSARDPGKHATIASASNHGGWAGDGDGGAQHARRGNRPWPSTTTISSPPSAPPPSLRPFSRFLPVLAATSAHEHRTAGWSTATRLFLSRLRAFPGPAMADLYPAYSPRTPTSNIPYSSVGAAPTYPYPPHSRYDGSAASLDSDSSTEHDKGGVAKEGRAGVRVRAVNRTPSPTPSEAKELAKNSVFDWDAMLRWRYWIRKEWIWYYFAFIICLVGVILFTVYHSQIVNWLKPAATWMHE